MLSIRFFLSLVAAVCFSTLASANSVNFAALRSGASISVATVPNHLSVNNGMATAVIFTGFNNHISSGGNAHIGGPLSGLGYEGNTTYGSNRRSSFSGLRDHDHNNVRFRTGNWTTAGRGQAKPGQGLSAPEPGSLMLLSTGLIGIAGMLRRKLLRG